MAKAKKVKKQHQKITIQETPVMQEIHTIRAKLSEEWSKMNPEQQREQGLQVLHDFAHQQGRTLKEIAPGVFKAV